MLLAQSLDQEIHDQNIVLLKINFKSNIKAAYFYAASISNPVIAINKNIDTTFETNSQKAHELGHHYTCCGNLLEISPRLQIKYETLAKRWALNRAMPLDRLINAYIAGARSLQELVECLEVSQEFIIHGITLYDSIYGPKLLYKGYTFTWDPFNIELTEENQS